MELSQYKYFKVQVPDSMIMRNALYHSPPFKMKTESDDKQKHSKYEIREMQITNNTNIWVKQANDFEVKRRRFSLCLKGFERANSQESTEDQYKQNHR